MNERTQLILKLIVTHIVLIIALLIVSIFITSDAFLALSVTQTGLFILYFAGYWEFFGRRFKSVFCGLIQLVLILILFLKIQNGSFHEINLFLVIPLLAIQLFLANELIRIFIVLFRKDKSSLDIEFPFSQGNYLITDGGNSKISRIMNYHYYSATHKRNKTNKSMLYAVDIVKLKDDHLHFFPKNNEDYAAFGEKIYSPLEGVVVKVVNDIPDNKPYAGNYPYNTGNTVVVKNDNYYLLMGHLMMKSIVVKVGDRIKTNDLIGAAGNSGWTERPHLHMQLIKSDTDNYWYGTSVSVLFKGQNLYKNRIVKT